MKRISVSFYDEIYEKLDARTKKAGLQSIAQCVRELVELALRIESASRESPQKEDEKDVMVVIQELKDLFKNNLNWALETRLLTRFLVENHPSEDREKRVEILNKYKNSANDYVKGLYGEKIE